jgi:hypothetical protein
LTVGCAVGTVTTECDDSSSVNGIADTGVITN